ncbi:hypothetical protein ES705_14799 [subsurface metagenome]
MKKNNRSLNFARKLDRISCFMSKISFTISCALVAIIAVVIFAYIIDRKFIGYVSLSVEEWSGFALIPITFLGLGYSLRRNRGIYVDLITTKLSPKTQTFLEIVFAVFSFFILISMLSASFEWFDYTLGYAVRSRGPTRLPLWIPSVTIILGLSVYLIDMFFYFFFRLFDFIGKDSGFKFDK